jgi:hypothetical protein
VVKLGMLPFDIRHADVKKIIRQIFEDGGLNKNDALTLTGYLTKLLDRNEYLKVKLDATRAMMNEKNGIDNKPENPGKRSKD